MTEEKLVLQDGTYKYDDRTRQVSVSEEQLKKAGYVKLTDGERMVKMVKLDQKKTKFMFENGCLPFYNPTSVDSFWHKAFDYSQYDGDEPEEVQTLLAKAYFNGYTIKKEKKYYIKLELNRSDMSYLNINGFGVWFLSSKHCLADAKTRFTQTEIDKMQKDPCAKGLDLNALKIEVPEDELED